MNHLTLVSAQPDQTMTSLELVDLINEIRRKEEMAEGESSRHYVELRHDNFCAKIAKHPGIDALKFKGVYKGRNGEDRPCYHLPEREVRLMVMSESLAVQTAVYDRMVAIEKAKQSCPVDLSDAAALRALLLGYTEKVLTLESKVAADAPKVAFVDQYVESSSGSKGFRQVAKLLKANEAEFRAFLQDQKIMYKLGGEWVPYQQHSDAGRFEVKTGTANEHAYTQAKFTAKGVEWVAGEWAKFNVRGAA